MSDRNRVVVMGLAACVLAAGLGYWALGSTPMKCDPWSRIPKGATEANVLAACGSPDKVTEGNFGIKDRYPTSGDSRASPYRGAGSDIWRYGSWGSDHVNVYFKGGIVEDVQIIGDPK